MRREEAAQIFLVLEFVLVKRVALLAGLVLGERVTAQDAVGAKALDNRPMTVLISCSVKCSIAASQTMLSNGPSGSPARMSCLMKVMLGAELYRLACGIASSSKSSAMIDRALV